MFRTYLLHEKVEKLRGTETYALALVNSMKFVAHLVLLCFRLVLVRRGNFAVSLKLVEKQLDDSKFDKVCLQLEQLRKLIPQSEHEIIAEVGRYESLIPSVSGSITRYYSQVAFQQISSPFALCLEISEAVKSNGELFAKPSYYLRQLFDFLETILKSHKHFGLFVSESNCTEIVLRALREFPSKFSLDEQEKREESASQWFILRAAILNYFEALDSQRPRLSIMQTVNFLPLLNDLTESITLAFASLIHRDFSIKLLEYQPNPQSAFLTPDHSALDLSNIRFGTLNYFGDLQRCVIEERDKLATQRQLQALLIGPCSLRRNS
jgi:hypothetical protein